MLWSACVHGTSCLCTLSVSAFMHWAIPTLARFLFITKTCLCFLVIKIFQPLLCDATHVIAVDVSSSHMYTDEWLQTASTLCPCSCPCRKVQRVSPSYAQSKAQMDHPKRISWLLVAVSNATRIVLWRQAGWQKRRKKTRTILTFDCFRFVTLKQLLLLLQTRAGSISCSMYL